MLYTTHKSVGISLPYSRVYNWWWSLQNFSSVTGYLSHLLAICFYFVGYNEVLKIVLIKLHQDIFFSFSLWNFNPAFHCVCSLTSCVFDKHRLCSFKQICKRIRVKTNCLGTLPAASFHIKDKPLIATLWTRLSRYLYTQAAGLSWASFWEHYIKQHESWARITRIKI